MSIVLGLLCCVGSVMASVLTVEDVYVREVVPGSSNTAAFMTLSNQSDKDIVITGAWSRIAKKVELHGHTMYHGMMKMEPVSQIVVKANSKIVLKPGGLHVMFLQLVEQLKEGETVDFILLLSDGKKIKVHAPVKKIIVSMKSHKMMGH